MGRVDIGKGDIVVDAVVVGADDGDNGVAAAAVAADDPPAVDPVGCDD